MNSKLMVEDCGLFTDYQTHSNIRFTGPNWRGGEKISELSCTDVALGQELEFGHFLK